jgi:hypothetical protein
MISDMNGLVLDFLKVADLAGINLSRNAITIQTLSAPHKSPSSLPKGKMAVYVFFWREKCLKVGKVGPKSQARYTSQHYSPSSSKSNLARSIISARKEHGLPRVSESKVGSWIKSNVDRVNLLLDSEYGILMVTLLESFIQCRLKPIFEGFEGQKMGG